MYRRPLPTQGRRFPSSAPMSIDPMLQASWESWILIEKTIPSSKTLESSHSSWHKSLWSLSSCSRLWTMYLICWEWLKSIILAFSLKTLLSSVPWLDCWPYFQKEGSKVEKRLGIEGDNFEIVGGVIELGLWVAIYRWKVTFWLAMVG